MIILINCVFQFFSVTQCNQHDNEVKAEDNEIEELDHAPLNHDANLKFELYCDSKVHQKVLRLENRFPFY